MSLFEQMARLEAAGTPFVLALVTETGGSTPRLAGARMVVCADGIAGTVGGGAFEQRVVERARALLTTPGPGCEAVEVHLVRDLAMCCGGRMRAFLTKVEPAPGLWVYGAGHVGTALARLGAQTGFAVTVIDERLDWADPQRFPDGVTVLDQDPEDHLRATPPPTTDFVVVLTHDHALDETLIRALTAVPRRYLGLIGSRRKWITFQQRLEARGRTPAQLAQVRCPVGLPIEAQTPEEIAVSIVAELVAVRRDASHHKQNS